MSPYPGLTAETRKVKWEHCQDGEIGVQRRTEGYTSDLIRKTGPLIREREKNTEEGKRVIFQYGVFKSHKESYS